MTEKKLTAKDFVIFKNEVLKWQRMLGLQDYRLKILFDGYNDVYSVAKVHSNSREGWAQVVLNKNYSFIPERKPDLRGTAAHEMFHVLIGELSNLAEDRYVSLDQLISAEERATAKFQNFVLEHYLPFKEKAKQ